MSYVEQLREELVAAAAREQARTGLRLHLPPLRPLTLVTAGVALAAIAAIAIAVGLGNAPPRDDRAAKPPATTDRPIFGGTLFPGERYRTRAFVPELSLTVSDDKWEARETDRADLLALARVTRGTPGPAGAQPTLVFQRFDDVYDPRAGSLEAAREPAPADLRAWLARHPDLRVSQPEAVTVAGVPGASFFVEVRFTRPAHSDPFCRETFRVTCTFLGPELSLPDGWRLHVIQLRVEGEPFVIFTVTTSPRRLAALDRFAAPVLDSLRFVDIP